MSTRLLPRAGLDVCGATLGPIAAIPQEKMAGMHDRRPRVNAADPQTVTAAVARGRRLGRAAIGLAQAADLDDARSIDDADDRRMAGFLRTSE